MSEEEKKKEADKDNGNWRKKFATREEMLRYLKSSGIVNSGPVVKHTASFK